ncbi:pentapeptide repeat-containing protein [Roseofilum capinflatum]|uniref:Pentapeptide repeat-containing protein n=1 Tax=Roseofilum capinflatum BLCC-M114 TaxID=3022440 RepID=A0ABT7BCD0_9CYAN|nr:pentapeptide repeat-containing protein [Roseofilum capinflatum]MDJ1176847.1 pentapeptide repeat-containing protein [Roseofilum capinflatum BLCC-M114]
MSQPLTENRYPEVLSLEWSVVSLSESTGDGQQYDLYLSLTLGSQWQSLGNGKLQWGLKGGELGLRLKEGFWCSEGGQEPDLSGIGVRAIASGTPENLTWRLIPLKSGQLLAGSMSRCKWGRIQASSSQGALEVMFSLKATDIQIMGAEGLWPHQVTPNQVAIAEQKLALMLLESSVQPYISRTVWQAQGDVKMEPRSEPPSFDGARALDLITQITTANTENFQELAQIAGLNLAQDLAGAKLLGTNLNGLDLSEANLSHVYLRGAELCDVDLSSANLQQANFGGADLSGAYLSDANLEGANFHRASLALANLSGANLTGADFTDANLSNANLSDTQLKGANFTGADLTGAGIVLSDMTDVVLDGAKVNHTRFKDNPGLTPAMHDGLLQRGAIFEEEETE